MPITSNMHVLYLQKQMSVKLLHYSNENSDQESRCSDLIIQSRNFRVYFGGDYECSNWDIHKISIVFLKKKKKSANWRYRIFFTPTPLILTHMYRQFGPPPTPLKTADVFYFESIQTKNGYSLFTNLLSFQYRPFSTSFLPRKKFDIRNPLKLFVTSKNEFSNSRI